MMTKPVKSNPFAPRQYGELYSVTERVYIFRNITNSSFVVGDRSVAVIDTQVNAPLAEEFLKSIRSVTGKPIEYVINTHYHWDHTNGNQLFKEQGATIISSSLTKDFMVRRAPRQKEFLAGRGFELGSDPLLPEITHSGEHRIDLGAMPIRIFFAGSAETEDASAVHVLSEDVLMSGDTVMTGSFPIFGQPVWDEGLEGDQWIKTIQNLLSLKPKHIVPGHGPLAYEAEVQLLVKIQKYFLEEVKALVDKGLDWKETLENLEPRLPGWITEIPIVWGTPRYAILRVYRGLTKRKTDQELGWQQYKPSVIPSKEASVLTPLLQRAERPADFLQMSTEAREGGDPALQISILKKGAEVFPDSAEVLSAFAESLIEASREEASVLEKGDFFQAARKCWDKALALEPSHPGALLGKGRYLTMMAYRGGDDPRAGMALLENVVQAKPGSRVQAEAEFYLGMGHRRLGDETKALAQFKKALEADPSFIPAFLASQC